MGSLVVFDKTGKEIDKVKVDAVFEECKLNRQLLHDVVVAHLANQRAGTASTKSRGEVRGSTRKPWRQKGTGRARIGTVSSPIWRSGGVAFGPKPRDFRQRISKKARKQALLNVFADKINQNSIVVVDRIECIEPKTKIIVELLKNLGLVGKKILIISTEHNDAVIKSVNNVPNASIVCAKDCNTFDCLNSEQILIEKGAIDIVTNRLLS